MALRLGIRRILRPCTSRAITGLSTACFLSFRLLSKTCLVRLSDERLVNLMKRSSNKCFSKTLSKLRLIEKNKHYPLVFSYCCNDLQEYLFNTKKLVKKNINDSIREIPKCEETFMSYTKSINEFKLSSELNLRLSESRNSSKGGDMNIIIEGEGVNGKKTLPLTSVNSSIIKAEKNTKTIAYDKILACSKRYNFANVGNMKNQARSIKSRNFIARSQGSNNTSLDNYVTNDSNYFDIKLINPSDSMIHSRNTMYKFSDFHSQGSKNSRMESKNSTKMSFNPKIRSQQNSRGSKYHPKAPGEGPSNHNFKLFKKQIRRIHTRNQEKMCTIISKTAEFL
ncbi:unnamed protein product [Moneuplotes crassus]|uniref:Uncharacterized protein n=1 Tax=Euplotes crassus TaxID=5936 RepID=A0AAD1UNP8_EUPCR|nr:unnamed protein product [Moneuplotes crassus]